MEPHRRIRPYPNTLFRASVACPFQNFETADGWIVIACAKEKFWDRLLDVLGLLELGVDPRFATFAARHEHRDTLLPILEARLREQTAAQWLKKLEMAGVPCGPIYSVQEALNDPQVEDADSWSSRRSIPCSGRFVSWQVL